MDVELSLPKEFLEYYKRSREEIQKLNRLLHSIELYLENKVSIGKAAELSGLPFDEFHEELAKRKIKRRGGSMTIKALEDELRSAESHLD